MQSAEPDDTLAEHLEMVRWSGATHGVPFDQWSVKGHPGMPVATFRQLKLYRTMKWLILKEPTRAAGPVSLATLFISFLTIGSTRRPGILWAAGDDARHSVRAWRRGAAFC